ELAERVQQRSMSFRVEEAAIVMLSVDLDRQSAKIAQQAGRNARSACERAAAAVTLKGPAQDQPLPLLGRDSLLLQQCDRRMVGRELDFGGHRRRILSGTDESRLRPSAQRQAECVE